MAKALVVTDLKSEAANKYMENAKAFFSSIDGSWDTLSSENFKTVRELLDLVENKNPDLIITYRHLHSEAWQWPHSLGEHLDVLIQVTEPPVAIMPHPDREGVPEHAVKTTDSVMAVNDHLVGEDGLVNHAIFMTDTGGSLHLTHIEDDSIFNRYMEVIGKIPEIDTDIARETIQAQLLGEPSDYIDSCETVLNEKHTNLKVIKHIAHGHPLEEYRKVVAENKISLVVLQAHDENQLAMNATAYSLAVELRTTPLLIV